MKHIVVNPSPLETLRTFADGPMLAPVVVLIAIVATMAFATWASR